MTEDQTRLVFAVVVVVAFTGFVMVVLMGLVAIDNPEMAKLVGATFGYLTGLITMVFTRYFRNNHAGDKL